MNLENSTGGAPAPQLHNLDSVHQFSCSLSERASYQHNHTSARPSPEPAAAPPSSIPEIATPIMP